MGEISQSKNFLVGNSVNLTKDQIAEILSISPELYQKFEEAYEAHALNEVVGFFDEDSKSLSKLRPESIVPDREIEKKIDWIVERTVDELLKQTPSIWIESQGKGQPSYISYHNPCMLSLENHKPLNKDDLEGIPIDLRPQLLGNYMEVQTPPNSSASAVLWNFQQFMNETNPVKKQLYYHLFRQGLDILDFDPLIYELHKFDPNTMSKWLPQIAEANNHEKFFRIPSTIICKIPMTVLQMSRLDYMSLNPTTLKIINEYVNMAFRLDFMTVEGCWTKPDFFIKTGTYSSKFNFRNAHIYEPKEVDEIGEYLIFLSNQASMLASPLNQPSFYGVSTNNEWVVREFIPDVENNLCIYHGLPLRTEYRCFVDFDTKEVLGVFPYWDHDLMAKRFGHSTDSDSPHNIHDYIILQSHYKVMDERFEKHKDLVKSKIQGLIEHQESLHGQWSIDIMQNGEDFWLIDMALAATSALREKLPSGTIKMIDQPFSLPAITDRILDDIAEHEMECEMKTGDILFDQLITSRLLQMIKIRR